MWKLFLKGHCGDVDVSYRCYCLHYPHIQVIQTLLGIHIKGNSHFASKNNLN